MFRIVCPHCHASLSTAELEQATIAGQLNLVCPECSSVLLSEPTAELEYHSLKEHFADAHASHT
jgi:Zn-finger nucleic acid-binding protein